MYCTLFSLSLYSCEIVRLITLWLDDTYLKAQTGKHFSGRVTVHIGAVSNKEMLLSQ